MNKPPLYILAGGNSTRFGGDKARYRWRGRPLLRHVVSQFSTVTGPVVVVAAAADGYRDLELVTIADRRPGLGPLAGLETAARHAGAAPLFVLASCDRLGVRRAWIELLIERLRRNPARLAAAFFHDGPTRRRIRWEPFPAVFRPAVSGLAGELLDRGVRVIARLLDEVGVAVNLPAGWESVVDANRPGDLPGGPG